MKITIAHNRPLGGPAYRRRLSVARFPRLTLIWVGPVFIGISR